MFSTSDTIAAIATPPGHGAIGIVRLTGTDAHVVALRLLAVGSPLRPRHATFTRAVVPVPESLSDAADGCLPAGGSSVDQVVATYFPQPHSYTGEDVVEISAHGSPIVLETILRGAVACGARLAEPGEFTLRAFLNDRIDLVQAEAVADLIDAVTPSQARAAFDQLQGTLTTAIADVEGRLFDLAARLEASVDFPDEGYHFIAPGESRDELIAVHERLDALVAEGERGRLVREGRQVTIAGKPNVGKSTLFNALLGTERAIVTPIAGTTRDLLTETASIAGAGVCLVDTAGLREAGDLVEREGVDRARKAIAVSDLVVVVLDASRPLEEEDRRLLRSTEAMPRVVVVNKSDLPAAWTVAALGVGDALPVSLLIQTDADLVRRAIEARVTAPPGAPRDVPAVTNLRHVALLRRASAAVGRAELAVCGVGQMPEEFLLADLQEARSALEEVTGRRTSEDMLRQIFSRFCIGK